MHRAGELPPLPSSQPVPASSTTKATTSHPNSRRKSERHSPITKATRLPTHVDPVSQTQRQNPAPTPGTPAPPAGCQAYQACTAGDSEADIAPRTLWLASNVKQDDDCGRRGELAGSLVGVVGYTTGDKFRACWMVML
ncbi:hypothetical protein BDZ85DRAFT_262547, partial [Elsinoe ampelina]